jgi:ABC-type branched-subunit amino acid transport system ATPase component
MMADYTFYLICLVSVLTAWWIDVRLEASRLGRAADAVRQDSAVAQTFGINPLSSMLTVFILSGAMAGFAGALWGAWSQFLHVDSFNYQVGLLFLMMVVIGPATSRAGVVLTAVFFGLFADVLQNIPWLVENVGVTKIAHFLLVVAGPLVTLALIHSSSVANRTPQARRTSGPSGTAPTVLLGNSLSSLRTLANEVKRHETVMALEVSGLSIRFGGLQALSDVNCSVRQGSITGLVGPNGAGKTTLFNCVSGLQRGWEGDIRIWGQPAAGLAAHERAGLGVSRTFQRIGLLKQSSVFENLLTARHRRIAYGGVAGLVPTPSALRGEREARLRTAEIIDRLGLTHIAERRVGTLPYGTQRLIEMSCALCMAPSLLMLDEPSAGMNPAEAAALGKWLRQVRAEFDLTLLIIEHHVPLIAGLCDQVYVLEFGRVIASGTPAHIRQEPAVISAFLGRGAP